MFMSRNLYKPTLCGVGYLGEGHYRSKEGNKIERDYNTFRHMLKRCYDIKIQEKQPTYKGCSVDERWHNFQVFAKWFEENYVDGFALDKDILVKGNKVYSPETCCFVPQDINSLFINVNKSIDNLPIGVSLNKIRGKKYKAQIRKYSKQIHIGVYETVEEAFEAYKKAKEQYIKEVANKYKHQITEACYKALINYKIEITD